VAKTLVEGFRKYAEKKGDKKAELTDAMVSATLAALSAEGEKIADELPQLKALTVAVRLSVKFAEGIGQGIDEANERFRDRYGLSGFCAEECTDKDMARYYTDVAGYLANNFAEVQDILTKGVAKLIRAAAEMMLDAASSAIKKAYSAMFDELASILIKSNDFSMALSDAFRGQIGAISSARRRIEGEALRFAIGEWVSQMTQLTDEEAQRSLSKHSAKELNSFLSNAGKKQIDLAILGNLLEMATTDTFRSILGSSDINFAASEFRSLVLNGIERLVLRLGSTTKITASKSGHATLSGEEISLPSGLLAELESVLQGSPPRSEINRMSDRIDQFRAYRDLRMLALRRQTASCQIRLRRADTALRENPDLKIDSLALYSSFSEYLSKERETMKKELTDTAESIVSEFGEYFGGYRVKEPLDNMISGTDVVWPSLHWSEGGGWGVQDF